MYRYAYVKSQPDAFQCIIPELGRQSGKAIKTWSQYSWWWNRNCNSGSVNIKPVICRYVKVASEQECMCQWIDDSINAQICRPDKSLHSEKQRNIRCYRIRIFSFCNTDIHLYFCSGKWRHCKRQVCNCVALNCLLVASRLTECLIAPLYSIERGFCCYSNSLPSGENYILFAEIALFRALSVHKWKQYTRNTNTKLEHEHKIMKYTMRYSDWIVSAVSTLLESNNLDGIFAEKFLCNLLEF
jgi:hypothetical protein